VFTEKEQKLIRLAMDQTAQPGERQNGAAMLLESLRKRGITAQQFITLSDPMAAETPKAEYRRVHQNNGRLCPHCQGPDWGSYEISFGRYNGKTLRQIPLSYLDWCLREMEDDPHQAGLLAAIRRYQAQKRHENQK
jgi:hypothetical protein